ncbi:hypothetical protein FRC06_009472 [Ceratobasidium sp. 370]|nr:hypothetical protein FRC06_009472 [Ceratobasidium sp. 370]
MTSRRPFSISELFARVLPTGYDPAKSPKVILRTAIAERNAGELAESEGDLERAFVHFGKAATLMVDEFPTHPRFNELTPTEKEAVRLHTGVVLHSMEKIKPALSDRFSDWRARHPDVDLSAAVPPYRPTRNQRSLPELPDSGRGGGRVKPTHDSRRQTSRPERASPVSALVSNPYGHITGIVAHKQLEIERQMQQNTSPREGEPGPDKKSEFDLDRYNRRECVFKRTYRCWE